MVSIAEHHVAHTSDVLLGTTLPISLLGTGTIRRLGHFDTFMGHRQRKPILTEQRYYLHILTALKPTHV